MNLSKERDGLDQPDSYSDPETAFRRRVVIALLVAPLLFVAAAVALVGVSVLFKADPEPHFQRAREALQQAKQASAVGDRHALARRAEAAVEESGDNSATAKLLRTAAIACRFDEPDISFADKQEFFALREQIQPDRCPIEDLLLAAQIFADQNRLAEAQWLLDNLLSREAKNPAVLRLAIEVAYFLGREKDVLRMSEILAQLDPEDPFAWQAQAYIAEDGGHPEAMIDAYRELLRRDPHAEIQVKLIEQLIEVGDARQAREQFMSLRDAAPDLVADRPALEAELLLLEGESKQARQQADEILARTPDHPGALLLRAKLALQSNEIQQAQKDLELLVIIDPISTEAHYLLGQTYNQQGAVEKAKHHLALQHRLLDTRVRLHQLERRAAQYPSDAQLRREIAALYSELGADELAQFWQRAAAATDAR
jgi:tetratricopeptide (TPR) repeat protein